MHSVLRVILILARSHCLTDAVLLEQVLEAHARAPAYPRCKAVFLLHGERRKLGLTGLKIVWLFVVAQVPVVMLLQQVVDRLC